MAKFFGGRKNGKKKQVRRKTKICSKKIHFKFDGEFFVFYLDCTSHRCCSPVHSQTTSHVHQLDPSLVHPTTTAAAVVILPLWPAAQPHLLMSLSLVDPLLDLYFHTLYPQGAGPKNIICTQHSLE